jgi:hypothetical protein
MDPQYVQPALGQGQVAGQGPSSEDSDLNQLARQTLASVPANLLPPEPFPSGFNLGALARSSRPPAPAAADEGDARLDLRAAPQRVAPVRAPAPRVLPPC